MGFGQIKNLMTVKKKKVLTGSMGTRIHTRFAQMCDRASVTMGEPLGVS